MESLNFSYPAKSRIASRAHVGVVASGDLEVLMEPADGTHAFIVINTSIAGFGAVWRNVLERFFARTDALARIEINDFGASPGAVMLRLQQAAEAAGRCR